MKRSVLEKSLSGFFNALSFLTVIPVPRFDSREDEFASGAAFFPLAGFVIGLFCAFSAFILSRVFSPVLTGVAVTGIWATISGGLHLDGLADTADGILGGKDVKSRLEIMKDSRIGTFGASALAITLMLKAALLAELESYYLILAVILSAAAARGVMVIAIYFFPAARPDGLGAVFKNHLKKRDIVSVTIIVGAVSMFCLMILGPVVLLLSLLVSAGAAFYINRKLGGLTGDSCGALCEISELSTLFFAVIVQKIITELSYFGG